MRRFCGIAFGLLTQVLFFITVYYLVPFLQGAGTIGQPGSLWIDVALALQFAVLHSLVLLPGVKKRLTPWVPAPFYGCFFCLSTCACLGVTFVFWRTSPVMVWQFTGTAATAMRWGFVGSWLALFYSLSLTGLGYQTGWTPWWNWFRGRPQPVRRFVPRGAYLWLRHPVYLSFLGLLWFKPVMTFDHALLTGIWTGYIFIGSYLKDQRLVFYQGESYREYQHRVPGFPGMVVGPLARVAPAASQAGGS